MKDEQNAMRRVIAEIKDVNSHPELLREVRSDCSGRSAVMQQNEQGDRQEHAPSLSAGGKRADSQNSIKVLSTGDAHKIYSRELGENRVSKLGDTKLPAARMTWDRLIQDFPVHPLAQRRLVCLAFEGPTKRIYESTAATNLPASPNVLWDLFEAKLFYQSRQRTQRATFYSLRMLERSEPVEQFGARPSANALSFPEHIEDEVLIHRFIEGLSPRLHTQALFVSGSCDEVVAKTSLIAKAQIEVKRFEPARQISEQRSPSRA